MKRQAKRIVAGILLLCIWLGNGRMGQGQMEMELLMPGVAGKEEESSFWAVAAGTLFPLVVGGETKRSRQTEDALTCQMLLAGKKKEKTEKKTKETAGNRAVNLEQLEDYNELVRRFYTIDSITYADAKLLNAKEMLAKDMTISKKTKGPKVLIFHTHSQEAFADSKKRDPSTTIVGMGAELAKHLNAKGIETLHHTGVYDLIDGKLDRSKAYECAEVGVRKILKEHPSIEVVIDLHRDGIAESTHLVTEIEGKPTAKIMFFNGLSRTRQNGEISYLKNPYRKENLAFSFQMQLACEQMYPGFARHIYLKGYRYSLHMMPKSLLIEAGAQNNTVEEMKNAMELLANVLVSVLK